MSPADFAMALDAARRSIIWDSADAVVAVIREREGIDVDPLDGPHGWQTTWTRNPHLVDEAIRLMWIGLGMTKSAAAIRMGYTPPRASYVATYTLTPNELDTLDEAESLVGRAP